MNTFSNLITANAKLLILIVLVITIFIVFNVIIKFLKKKLLKKAKKKKQISNIKIFTRILQIVFSSLVLFECFKIF